MWEDQKKWPRVSYGNASSSAGELHEACWNATHSTPPPFPAAAAPARHIVDHVPHHVGDVCRDVTLNDIGNPVAVLILEARLARTLLVTSHGQSSDFVSVNTCKPSCCCPLCSSATLPLSSVEGLLSNLVYAPRTQPSNPRAFRAPCMHYWLADAATHHDATSIFPWSTKGVLPSMETVSRSFGTCHGKCGLVQVLNLVLLLVKLIFLKE